MCGIAGEIRFDTEEVDASAVGRMAETLHPRGPTRAESSSRAAPPSLTDAENHRPQRATFRPAKCRRRTGTNTFPPSSDE